MCWVNQCNSKVLQTGCGGGVPSRLMLWGSEGKATSSWAIFCNFLEKKAILMLLVYISRLFKTIRKKQIFNILKPLEKD